MRNFCSRLSTVMFKKAARNTTQQILRTNPRNISALVLRTQAMVDCCMCYFFYRDTRTEYGWQDADMLTVKAGGRHSRGAKIRSFAYSLCCSNLCSNLLDGRNKNTLGKWSCTKLEAALVDAVLVLSSSI